MQTFQQAHRRVLQGCVPQGRIELPDSIPIAVSSYCSCNCCCCNTGTPAGTIVLVVALLALCLLAGVYDLGEVVQPTKAVFVMLLHSIILFERHWVCGSASSLVSARLQSCVSYSSCSG
jgi:hypothetical protein